jgi:hypothetical protein
MSFSCSVRVGMIGGVSAGRDGYAGFALEDLLESEGVKSERSCFKAAWRPLGTQDFAGRPGPRGAFVLPGIYSYRNEHRATSQ